MACCYAGDMNARHKTEANKNADDEVKNKTKSI